MKLKTLKDIEEDTSEYGYVYSPTLRQEAIKWIKALDKDMEEIRKSPEAYQEMMKHKQIYGEIPTNLLTAKHQIQWIQHFFDITYEELK